MLTISNLSKSFRGQRILDGVNWFAPDRTCIGLTGMNGAGKSTLLRLIAGQMEPDSGEIVLPKGTTRRVPAAGGHRGLRADRAASEAMDAFADLHALEAECRRLEDALAACAGDGSRARPR